MKPEEDSLSVLYVINGLGTGGAERSLAELLEPLRRRGVEITVACLYERDEGVEEEVRANHDVRFVGPGLAKSLRNLRRLLREERPDLIHTTIFEADIVGRLASFGMRIPLVTSIVNTSYLSTKSGHPDVSPSKLRIARAIDGLTARHLNTRFHALTSAVASAAVAALGISPERIEVIPRGRSLSRLGSSTPERRRRVRRDLRLTDDDIILLSVGRREHQKGQIHAISALRDLEESHPQAMLLIAGREGAASARLRQQAENLGVGRRVQFLGHREDLPDLMVAADILVFPSLYEGLGGSVIEAMALGLPVVASDIAALREVASDAALFVPLCSPQALAGAVARVVDDPDLAEGLRLAGQERFAGAFGLESVADRMAAFYRTTVDSDPQE